MNGFEWIELPAALVGSLCFGVLFGFKGKRLFAAALGGLISWAVFMAAERLLSSEGAQYFIAALAASFYSEAVARIFKTPASSISIVAMIPLIPGSYLYYTMRSVFDGTSTELFQKAFATVEIAGALALGVIAASALTGLFVSALRRLKARRVK